MVVTHGIEPCVSPGQLMKTMSLCLCFLQSLFPALPLILCAFTSSTVRLARKKELRSGFMRSHYPIHQPVWLSALICQIALCNKGSKYNSEAKSKNYLIHTEFRFSCQTSCTDEQMKYNWYNLCISVCLSVYLQPFWFTAS